jgi:hypothetical protein
LKLSEVVKGIQKVGIEESSPKLLPLIIE